MKMWLKHSKIYINWHKKTSNLSQEEAIHRINPTSQSILANTDLKTKFAFLFSRAGIKLYEHQIPE